MEIIEKNIPQGAWEKQEQETGRKQLGPAAKLPVFLIRWYIRKNYEAQRHQPGSSPDPLPPEGAVTEARYETMGYRSQITVHVYRPRKAPEGKSPLFYFIHGGGFVGGSALINRNLLCALVERRGITAASVDYHLAPEAKFPEALGDVQNGLEFLLESAGLGIDRDRVTIAGDSAGGNLAAVLALKLDQEESPGKRRQVLLYPVTDMQGIDRESYHEKALENVMMRKLMLASRDLYLPSKEDRANPLASPLLAQFGRPQSDALILVAERDGLRSDGLDYGEALARAGTRVRCVLYRGAFHAFINNLGRSGVADDALEEIINFI